MKIEYLFRFVFEPPYVISTISLNAENFNKALSQLALVLGESSLDHISSIQKVL